MNEDWTAADGHRWSPFSLPIFAGPGVASLPPPQSATELIKFLSINVLVCPDKIQSHSFLFEPSFST